MLEFVSGSRKLHPYGETCGVIGIVARLLRSESIDDHFPANRSQFRRPFWPSLRGNGDIGGNEQLITAACTSYVYRGESKRRRDVKLVINASGREKDAPRWREKMKMERDFTCARVGGEKKLRRTESRGSKYLSSGVQNSDVVAGFLSPGRNSW